jgi:hypothetical protein
MTLEYIWTSQEWKEIFLKFSQDIAKDVSFKIVFGFVLILDILIIRRQEQFTQTIQKYIAVVKEIAISAEWRNKQKFPNTIF